MLTLGPGIALIAAAALLVVLAVLGRLTPEPAALGRGPMRAMFLGAAVLAVLGGALDWRHSALERAEAQGVELATWLEADTVWFVSVPFFALGMAILAVAVRQVLRRKVQGAAGWVGLVIVLAGLGLEESSGRLWVDATTHRVQVRRGAIFVRESVASTSAVEEVRISTQRVRGAPMVSVRLAGAALPKALTALGYDSRDAHLARVEAERWAKAGGWVVREEESMLTAEVP